MPERQKVTDQEIIVMKTVKVGDKWVQKEITITESVLAWENFDLYNESDEIIGKHQVAVMESYEEEEEESEEEEEEE